MPSPKKVIIVGGGIAGLATSYYLEKYAKEKNLPILVTLLEKSHRLGGIVQSYFEDFFLIESGPDAFLTEKTEILDFIRELKLEDELIPTQEKFRRSFIFYKNALQPMPKGFYLITPTSFKSLWNIPFISFLGKLRIAMELFIPSKKNKEESIAEFVIRRFGREAYEKLAEPMLAGIYSGDLHEISVEAAFPKFKKLESEFGSLIRSYLSKKSSKEKEASGPRYSLFVSFKRGMQSLISGVVEKLTNTNICLNSEIRGIEKLDSWKITTNELKKYEANVLCLSTPAFISSELISSFNPTLSKKLREIAYKPIVVINLCYNSLVIDSKNEGFGFVVPMSENKCLLGCSFSSLKFPGRAPEGKSVLRVFIGKQSYEDMKSLTNEALGKVVANEIERMLNIKEKPAKIIVTRYDRALPQYTLGHLERIHQIEEIVSKENGLYLTGNAYRGIGIPDTVIAAKQTAEKIIKDLFDEKHI